MHSSRAWRGTAAAAAIVAACGLAVTGTEAAIAANSAGTSITISAKSAFAPVTGFTFVQFFGSPKTDAATISGTVSGIPSGMDAAVTLLTRPFGAKSFTAGKPASVAVTAGTAHYSFSVAPPVATTYEAQVTESPAPSPSPSPSSTSPTPTPSPSSSSPSPTMTTGTTSPSDSASAEPSDTTSEDAPDAARAVTVAATSAPVTVYVIADGAITGNPACTKPIRPVCHVNLNFVIKVPLGAFKLESSKHLFIYAGLTLSKTGTPKPPTTLTLRATADVSKVRKLAPREFEFTGHFVFTVGNDGFEYLIVGCLQDTEARDGVNLPGRHSCGAKSIPVTINYLG